MILDPISLRLFVSAVEEGSIAATAAREHIASAAVSRRLSELEAILNTRLFVRSNKGIEATAAGHTLVNLAHQVLYDINNVYAKMQDYRNGTRGHVRVFASMAALTQFLPRELKGFLVKHPHVEVGLEEVMSAKVTKGVLENAADVGVFVLGTLAQNLKIFPYRKGELVLVVSKEHPLAARRSVSIEDILDFDFIGLHSGSWINSELMKTANELGRTPKLRMRVMEYDALCLMVEAGLGIGILPKGSGKPYVSTMRLKTIALSEPWAKYELGICVRSYDELSPVAKLLVDHLLSARSEV
jgi:DNA-binding transcriptional LysR family regulator